MIAIQQPSSLASNSSSFNGLPAEILLEIVPHIPYSPHNIYCLCLTCTKLNALIKGHEHGLVTAIANHQFCSRTLSLFPGLIPTTFADLSILFRRIETLNEIHGQWLQIVNHGIELQWLKGRWESIHKAGLLLLYRLFDTCGHQAKVDLLDSLPASSLACLLFKLISSIKILRVYGPEPINASHARSDHQVRSDVELAFEELLLQHGPELFVVMLKAARPEKSAWAVGVLETEVQCMYERQMPYPTGEPKPPTLISSLRRALAAQAGCAISHTVDKMWEILASTPFDQVDNAKLSEIVRGVSVAGGMKRMGF